MSTLTGRLQRRVCGPQRDSLAYRTIGICCLPADRHVFAGSRKSDPPTPSIVCRCPQGGQGDLGSAWLAQSGRADRSLEPEGSTDRFDTRALKRRFLKRCNKRCNAFWAFVTV